MRKKHRKERFEVLKVAKKYDRETGKFFIDIRYRIQTEITPRTTAVAEAFGLGIDEFQERVIYDNAELKIGPGDIVYITGESGSGKSVLLKALENDLGVANVINIRDIAVDSDKPLIDMVGETFQQSLTLLSKVGLSDAFLFLRRYSQLSEGQKYRFKLAKLIESGKQYWIADEFCSTLDRDTAKIVAFNVQKLARKNNRTVLVATAHDDLLEDLAPSVYIRKETGKKLEVKYLPNKTNRVCSVTRDMHIEEGSRGDYKKLAGFHYRGSSVPPPLKFFALKRSEEVVGVIVYSYPSIITFGRRKAFGRQIPVSELNRRFALISRVILHPKYRSIGLGARLVKETLPLVGRPFVEAVAVMARYNPFFEAAGMTKIAESKPDKTLIQAVEELRGLGFNPVTLASETANRRKLQKMNASEIEECRRALMIISAGYFKRLKATSKAYVKRSEFREFIGKATVGTLAKVLRRVAVLTQTKVYLLWRSPCFGKIFCGGAELEGC